MQDFYKEARTNYLSKNYEKALELYQEGIAAGDEKCWYGYAVCFRDGYALEKDYNKAISIVSDHFNSIKDLAYKGDVYAARIIGFCYYVGLTVEINFTISLQFILNYNDILNFKEQKYNEWKYERKFDNDVSVKIFGSKLSFGDQIDELIWACEISNAFGENYTQCREELLRWYRSGAEQGDSECQWRLGKMCEGSDYEEALKWYKLSAEQENSTGQWRLGRLYALGFGVEKNDEEAIKWYNLSAEQGNREAQLQLGHMYCDGIFVKTNYKEAIKWYRLSAEQGNHEAQSRLGYLYNEGVDIELNIDEAIKWYKKLAEHGCCTSQWRLGKIYESGKCTEPNYEEALKWYQKSAECGFPISKWHLGYMYEKGLGVEASIDKAIAWWTEACDDEEYVVEQAAYRLGCVYFYGESGKTDLDKAKHYFKLAAENGYPCIQSIDIIDFIQGKKSEDNLMRQYADEIVNNKKALNNLYNVVQKSLKKDFGKSWDKLQINSQKALMSGIVSYITFIAMGGHVYGNLDFTSAITPMLKALEIELGRYLYADYINYLIDNNIPSSSFSGGRSFIKPNGSYEDPNNLKEFSLGSMKQVIGLDKIIISSVILEPQRKQSHIQQRDVIDKPMLEYLKTIFKEDAFGSVDQDQAITDYIAYFSREMKTIADSMRNPAAHTSLMSRAIAETCANQLFKNRKVLCKFLDYLK